MAIPITIEGTKYFVSLPKLPDLRNFKEFLRREHRRAAYAAIPDDVSDAQMQRFMRVIEQECEAIDPFKDFSKLASNSEGVALLFHALLRHDNPNVTLDWVNGLIARAEDEKPAALEAIRDLRQAFKELMEAKKNELQPPGNPPEENPQPSTSTPSTSR